MLAAIKSYFHRVYQRFESQREGRTRTVHRLTHDSNGLTMSSLTIENEAGLSDLYWRDVIRVEAFKRDLFAVDQICLAFITNDDAEVEISEEMEGFGALAEQLPNYLPGCEKWNEWFQPVAIPAFELNLRVIYKRENVTAT